MNLLEQEKNPRENSRNPIIENGSLEDDQKRDFTINCLYVKLVGENYGILDPFNGLIDLKNK